MFRKNKSYRDLPITIKTIREGVHLNVRKGLEALDKSTKAGKDKFKKFTVKNGDEASKITLEDMTAGEYVHDLRAHHGIHQNKLRDILYIDSFREAILDNKHLFKDKIVVDIRCGLGVLSMFSVLAGAKHVYAIDNSNVTQLTERIIRDNNVFDKITVIKGTVANIQLPVTNVDIIVSTFFGESLIIENGLDEVIVARDKWLKPNGLILPDRCTLYLAALSDHFRRNRGNFWHNVYSFGMEPMIESIMVEPYLHRIRPDQVVTTACPVLHVNLYDAKMSDYKSFDAYFRLEGLHKCYIGSFFTYFDVEFTNCHKPLKLCMKPDGFGKAWAQLVFNLNSRCEFDIDENGEIFGTFSMQAVSDNFQKVDWKFFVIHEVGKTGFRETWNFQTRRAL